RGIFLCVAIVLASLLSGDPAAAFGEGSWSDSVLSSLGVSKLQVDPYVKVGYQRMSVNLNVPVPPSNWGAETEDIDVKMAKQDFAIGSLGVRGLVGQRFGLFAEASVSALNSGAVETFTSFGYWIGLLGPSGLSWSTERVRWWEVNLGGSVSILDSGSLLLGYKFDRLAQKLTRPHDMISFFGVPIGEDHFGDLDIQTWSPYVGFRIDDRFWRFDLIWSPWLTSYRTTMPLRWVIDWTTPTEIQESLYGLRGSRGNLFEAYGEARFNVFDRLAAKLWGKASWLNCPGNGDRDMISSLAPSESQSATGSLARYLWALGVSGEIKL
ncbi:MAG: hypothetical protein WCP72_12225, partial [Desulfomonile sp.]